MLLTVQISHFSPGENAEEQIEGKKMPQLLQFSLQVFILKLKDYV